MESPAQAAPPMTSAPPAQPVSGGPAHPAPPITSAPPAQPVSGGPAHPAPPVWAQSAATAPDDEPPTLATPIPGTDTRPETATPAGSFSVPPATAADAPPPEPPRPPTFGGQPTTPLPPPTAPMPQQPQQRGSTPIFTPGSAPVYPSAPAGYPTSAPPGYSTDTPPGGPTYPKTSPLPPHEAAQSSPYARPPGTPPDAPFAPPDPAAAYAPQANPYAPPPPQANPYAPSGPAAPYNPYNAAPAYDQPVKRKRGNGPIIALVVVLALLFCGGVATAGVLLVANRANDDDPVVTQPTNPNLPDPDPQGPDTDPVPPTDEPDDPGIPTQLPGLPGVAGKTVVYEVTGSGRADITYVDDLAGQTRELKNEKLPWKRQFTSTEGSLLLTVSATRSNGDNEDLGCRITVDGREAAAEDGSIIGAFCIGTIFN
ncbi:MmpS family transport accessory protein [Asanoa sp. WMMD1127]|uniref:MmpS family transport accessory protein n=1 Tax=Asanoa sp. WMMD1127 TaxID=3016107 RepID=UPI00241773DE|nr:MmpS family transport accessory protein [Asanoa sp. WMMD1127]MDG4821157.1 MmpS family transport accessory protein [Asanoa sp. WMMD1127]